MATEQERLVRDPETTILTGLGKSQRHRLEEKGLFPERKRLSPMGRATGYLLSELNAWIVSRSSASSSPIANVVNCAPRKKGHRKQPAVTA